MMCGGITNSREATNETQEILDSVKKSIEEKLNTSLETLEAKSLATQVVAGTNYFIKAHIGSDKYIHARIFKSLQQEISLHSLQENKTLDDSIEYF